MISVSNAFKTAIIAKSRQFTARLLVNGSAIDCDIDNIKCHKGSCGSELALGSVYASYIEGTLKRCGILLANKEITYQVGLLVNGAYEYVTMGKYTVLEEKESNGTVTFTAVSTLTMKANDSYSTESIGASKNISQVLSDIASAMGVTSSIKGITPSSDYITGDVIKGSVSDVLALLGTLAGGFITEDNAGNIVLSKYNAGDTLSVQPYQSISLPEYSTPYLVAGVHITVKAATDTTAEVYFEHGTPMIIQTCERMTQSLFDAMYPNIEGIQFDLAKVNMALGDPRIEPWDVLAVTDLSGSTHNVPCFEIVHTFNGGFETEVTAQVGSTDVNSKNVKGALEKVVERLDGDVMKAAIAASEAEELATQAAASAQSAASSASAAATSASNAETSAQASATSASNSEASAQASAASAHNAEVSALESENQATIATKYANAALDQLSVMQDVVGVLNWAKDHGSFVLTPDTEVQEGKVYFTYDSTTGDYSPVVYPETSELSTYYELTVDEAMEDFIMSHLAVTSRGLWVLPNGIGSGTTPASGESQTDSDARQSANYKVLLSNDGMYVYDDAGVLVSQFGENIEFNSTRPQYIGNSQTYIAYNPDYGGSLVINGATINLTNKTLEETLSDFSDKDTQINKAIASLQGSDTEISDALSEFKDLYNGYITIRPNDPSITLGKSTGNNKVEITDSAVNFLSENKTTAFASGQTFNAYEGSFETVMMKTMDGTGSLRWVARSNGHLSLKKVT